MQKQINEFLKQNSEAYKKLLIGGKYDVKGAQMGERIFFASNVDKPLLYIVSSAKQAQEVKRHFVSLGKTVQVLTSFLDSLAFQMAKPYGYDEILNALQLLTLKKIDVIVACVQVLLQRVPNKKDFIKNAMNLKIGNEIDFKLLFSNLTKLGYTKVDEITDLGEYRLRGDTLEIYLLNYDDIIRIEFFDNEIENIFSIEKEDYKTKEKLDSIDILPYSFVLDDFQKEDDKDILYYLPKSEHAVSNIASWFEEDYIIIDEPSRCYSVLKKAYEDVQTDIIRRIGEKILDKFYTNLYISVDNCKFNVCKNVIAFESLDIGNAFFFSRAKLYFSCPTHLKYGNDTTQMYKDIQYYDRQNFTIVICVSSKQAEDIVAHRLKDLHLSYKITDILQKNQINIMRSNVESSFGFLDQKLIVLSTQSFDGYRLKKVDNVDKARVFYLPKVGDYVVHENYGVAKCVQISRLNFGISEKDYFVLEYANGGVLYVPTEHVDQLSSYIGEKEPKLDTLGSDSFKKAKAKAKDSVKKLAYDLKKLYAIRESKQGFKYEINQSLLQEFEDSFGFELTTDQKQAVEEVIKDMSSGKIMDRLVCGDVGFGKTEVAMIATFLTVLNAKQVAILVPTSILCHQHYISFKKRLLSFGIKVEQLSKLQSSSKNKEVIEGLKSGDVNVVCGTKRMLSKDVSFSDLGLLILDEEQRFGVNDKEKIKEIKKDVNVLTLSATPIPRTLNMSLIGVRDISLITTPPKNRQAVQTIVCEEQKSFILEACKREMQRGGQVLIVYNRVVDINVVASEIKRLLPEASIGIAHGQMRSNELEQAVLDLYENKTQIMVATSLIENGIDLPMANTLIVLNAGNFGLSQLYQLKGRVGRGNRLAYAYFMYKKEQNLTQNAYERLKAIKEFTSLGSGFKLAMRDLELRGAGDILGANQHGHIAKLGYDMYCKLLEEALNEIDGEKVQDKKEVKIDVTLPAFIPHTYIEQEDERIKIYNQISRLQNKEEQISLINHLQDIYGSIPNEVYALAEIGLLKNIAQNYNIKRIILKNSYASIEFYELDGNILNELVKIGFKKDVTISNKYELKTNIQSKQILHDLLLQFLTF